MSDAFFAVLPGVLIPFMGTILGSACVFCLRRELGGQVQRAFTGFAAGVMTAASVWSLLIPAMDQSAHMGGLAFAPAALGLWLGILFLLALDKLIPHLHMNSSSPEGLHAGLKKSSMLLLAVAIHNLPEGMAVGVVYAGLRTGGADISVSAALALAIGIAIQNVPEGAIISMPLHSVGMSRRRAFLWGVLSGAVEPLGVILVILASSLLTPAMPYFLGFAAGAMLYVVVEELIPEMSQGDHSNVGTLAFGAGFTAMMILDVALG